MQHDERATGEKTKGRDERFETFLEEKVKRLEMEKARKESKGFRDTSSEWKKKNERRISEIAGNLLDG